MGRRDVEKVVHYKHVQDNRYDRDLHMIFADWLEENGYDDEAVLERKWTPERQEAEDWLRALASNSGETCLNYGARTDEWRQRGQAWLDAGSPAGKEPTWDDIPKIDLIWVPITYEMLIQAGHDYIDSGEFFVQMGQEDLRDAMFGENLELFWKHWKTITERDVDEETRSSSPFGCSC